MIVLAREINLYFTKKKKIKMAVVGFDDSNRISIDEQRRHPGQIIDIHGESNDDKGISTVIIELPLLRPK